MIIVKPTIDIQEVFIFSRTKELLVEYIITDKDTNKTKKKSTKASLHSGGRVSFLIEYTFKDNHKYSLEVFDGDGNLLNRSLVLSYEDADDYKGKASKYKEPNKVYDGFITR